MSGYSKDKILSDLADALREPSTLYKKAFINYRGTTTDTGEKYTEALAATLLENISALESIPSAPRTKGYKVVSHDGTTKADSSNREEERIALSMFHKEYNGIGRILDYQVPLKNTNTDKGFGKIDLLSYDGRCLRLLELKRPGSAETLLRCVLEVYTYRRIVDDSTLLESYELPCGTDIGKAAIIYSNCAAHEDYHGNSTNVRRLMADLGVELFVLDINNTEITELRFDGQ